MGSNFNDQSKTREFVAFFTRATPLVSGRGGHGLTTKPIHTGPAMALVDELFDEVANARDRLIEAILRVFL